MRILSGHLLIVVALLAGCKPEQQQQALAPLVVNTQVIMDVVVESTRNFNGIVEPAELTPLAFRMEGELIQLLVKPGHKVLKGQLIARLDDRKIKQAFTDAKAQFTLTERQLKRASTLAEKKLISPAEYDELKANVKLTRANYKLMQAQLDYTYLYAPFSGVIAEVSKKSFESVSLGEPVATLYRNDLVYVRVALSDSLLAQFDPRTQDKKYQPHVKFSGSQQSYLLSYLEHTSEPSPETHAFEVWFSMPQVKPEIRPGTSATLHVNLEQAGLDGFDGYLIPMNALDTGPTPGTFTVWKWVDGRVHEVAVVVSQVHSRGVLVSSGINKGDILVISGLEQLREAMKVELTQEQPS